MKSWIKGSFRSLGKVQACFLSQSLMVIVFKENNAMGKLINPALVNKSVIAE